MCSVSVLGLPVSAAGISNVTVVNTVPPLKNDTYGSLLATVTVQQKHGVQERLIPALSNVVVPSNTGKCAGFVKIFSRAKNANFPMREVCGAWRYLMNLNSGCAVCFLTCY